MSVVRKPWCTDRRVLDSSPRARIGVYEPGAGLSGQSRYMDSILSGIDRGEFEVVIFGHPTGPYSSHPDVTFVGLSDVPDPIPATGEAPPANEVGACTRILRMWRRFAPSSLKLWTGFGRECIRLGRAFRREPVDLIHTNNTGCDESAVAVRLAGIPRVLGTFHVDSTYDLANVRSGVRHRVLEHVSNHCLDVGIGVSSATSQDWVRRTHLSSRRVTTIYNGINPERFHRRWSQADARRQLGLPIDSLIVGGVGRLEEAKGFEYLIAAAAQLLPAFPTLCIVIAGAGPLRQELEAKAARHGVSDRIRFLGFQADVQLPLDALDVFGMPSLCEALPYALLEAMAAELPVVGTAVGGVPEVIIPGQTGFVVPPRDPDRLAGSLRVLLEDASLRARMGTAARERVVHDFHERDMVRRTIALYRDALHLPQSTQEWARPEVQVPLGMCSRNAPGRVAYECATIS